VYIHAFLFQWQDGVSAEMKERAARDIRALQGQVPGLLETSYGANVSPRSQGFTHGGVMKFSDLAALQAYGTHPAHEKLLQWLRPQLKLAAELDYEL
jgi:Stress responsive A/B Barrel Domain